MKPAGTWSVKGIDSITRELAKKAAHQRGMTLGQWLNEVVRHQAAEADERPAEQDRRAAADPDIAGRLDELAEQLRALVRKEQSTAVARFASPDEAEAAGLAEVIERIERNEAATAKTLDVINARLDELAGQMREMASRVSEHDGSADAMKTGELETALRNVMEHLEQSEARTSETLEHIQRRLDDVAAQATEATAMAGSGEGGKTLADIEQRLDVLNGHLAEIRERTDEETRAYVDAHLEKLAERVEAVYRTSQGLPGKVEGLVSEIAESRFGEIESRIDTMVSRLRARLEEMASGALEADRIAARVDELDRKLDKVASQAASAQELDGMRAAIEQLSLRVDTKADRKDFDAIARRLETFIAGLKEERSKNSPASDLEKRVLELERTLRRISESGEGPAAAVAGETAIRLEKSIELIEKRLGKAEDRLNHLPVLENSIAALNRALEDMQLSAEEPGEGAHEEIRALQEGLEAVKDAASRSDTRTQETLKAVHETLAHIIDKLDTFEKGAETDAVKPGGPVPGKEKEPEEAGSENGRQAQRQEERAETAAPDIVSRLASEAAKAAKVADSAPETSETPMKTGKTAGSGNAAEKTETVAAEDAPLKEDFIAAARRAAMAASGKAGNSAHAGSQGLIERLRKRRNDRDDESAAAAADGNSAKIRPRHDEDGSGEEEDRRRPFSLSFFGRNRKDPEAAGETGEAVGETEEAVEATGGSRRRRLLLMGVVLLAAVSALIMRQQQNEEASDAPAPVLSAPVEGKKTDDAPAARKASETPDARKSSMIEDGERRAASNRSTYLFEKLNARIAALSDAEDRAGKPEGIITASLGKAEEKASTAQKRAEDGRKTDATEEVGTPALRTAAAKGDPKAQFIVGSHYLERRDFARAAEWFEKAAKRGLAVAQYRFGTLHERGRGVPRNAKEALKWYEKAAKAGNVKAMHNLAVLLTNGQGGRTSYADAARWFLSAARHGLRDSQYNLAVLYQRGLGVLKDEEEAYKWFGIAARIGDADAARLRDSLKSRLDKATLRRLDREIASWKPARAIKEANFILVNHPEWRSKTETAAASASVPGKQGTSLSGPARIRRIQELLNRLGYDVGKADGKMGNRTANAIRLFQLQAGLPVNGQPGEQVLRLLERRAGGNVRRKGDPSA